MRAPMPHTQCSSCKLHRCVRAPSDASANENAQIWHRKIGSRDGILHDAFGCVVHCLYSDHYIGEQTALGRYMRDGGVALDYVTRARLW